MIGADNVCPFFILLGNYFVFSIFKVNQQPQLLHPPQKNSNRMIQIQLLSPQELFLNPKPLPFPKIEKRMISQMMEQQSPLLLKSPQLLLSLQSHLLSQSQPQFVAVISLMIKSSIYFTLHFIICGKREICY